MIVLSGQEQAGGANGANDRGLGGIDTGRRRVFENLFGQLRNSLVSKLDNPTKNLLAHLENESSPAYDYDACDASFECYWQSTIFKWKAKKMRAPEFTI